MSYGERGINKYTGRSKPDNSGRLKFGLILVGLGVIVVALILIIVTILQPSASTMSDAEILDKAAIILADRGFDLNAALQEPSAPDQPSETLPPSDASEPAEETVIDPATETESDIGTRKNPVPVGQVLSGALSISGDPLCSFDISIIDVVRGEDAWKMIEDANQFNDAPGDDEEYVLVKVRIKNTKDLTGSDEALEISGFDFELATSSDSISDNQPVVVTPSPELDLTLYEGSEDEGYMAFLASKADANIKAVFADSFWFLLQ